MKKLLFIILVCTFASLAYAQLDNYMRVDGGQGYFSLGVHNLDQDDFDTRVEGFDFSKLSSSYFTIGGGGGAFIDRFYLGGEGYALIGQSKEFSRELEEPDGLTSIQKGTMQITGGYGLFKVGYSLYSKGHFNFYPTLGMGGGSLTFNCSQNNRQEFDQILNNGSLDFSMTNNVLLFDLGLATDYYFNAKDNVAGGLMVGLRLGYTATASEDWSNTAGTITQAPELGMDGYYLRLSLGGGGIKRSN